MRVILALVMNGVVLLGLLWVLKFGLGGFEPLSIHGDIVVAGNYDDVFEILLFDPVEESRDLPRVFVIAEVTGVDQDVSREFAFYFVVNTMRVRDAADCYRIFLFHY